MTKEELRFALIESLTAQGFNVNGHVVPTSSNKNFFRKIQAHSMKEQIILQKDFLTSNYDIIENYLILL